MGHIKVSLPNKDDVEKAIILDEDTCPEAGAYRIISTSEPNCTDSYLIIGKDNGIIFIDDSGRFSVVQDNYSLDYGYTLEHVNCALTITA